MFFPFMDYITFTVGSNASASDELIYTTPNYKSMICLEIVTMERNSKDFQMWAEVSPSDGRNNYFIRNYNLSLAVTNPGSFGMTKILKANTLIKRNGDFSPFTGIFHVFRLPE